MRTINTVRCSLIRDHMDASRTKRVLLPLGALLLICSVGSSFGQIDSAQLIDRNLSKPQTVSRNQLLAPGKALRAVKRAYKDIAAGHFEAAQKEIGRALDIAPHYAVAKVMQGAINLENKNYEGATAFFQQAIDDDPGLGGAYVGMAVILIHQQRCQAALPLLDRAEGLLPGAWFVHFVKAWAELKTGNSEVALKQSDIAEGLAGADSNRRSGVSYLRALAFIRMNDLETARRHLAETVARDPGGDYAPLAKRELERLQPLLAAR